MSNLPLFFDNFTPNFWQFYPQKTFFMWIYIYCQIASRIIQNLQQNFFKLRVWPPPPPPLEQSSKKQTIWYCGASLSTYSLLNGLQFRVLNMLFSNVVLQSSLWHETLSQTLQVQVLKESSLQCDQSCGSSGLFQELTVVTEWTFLYLILLPLI